MNIYVLILSTMFLQAQVLDTSKVQTIEKFIQDKSNKCTNAESKDPLHAAWSYFCKGRGAGSINHYKKVRENPDRFSQNILDDILMAQKSFETEELVIKNKIEREQRELLEVKQRQIVKESLKSISSGSIINDQSIAKQEIEQKQLMIEKIVVFRKNYKENCLNLKLLSVNSYLKENCREFYTQLQSEDQNIDKIQKIELQVKKEYQLALNEINRKELESKKLELAARQNILKSKVLPEYKKLCEDKKEVLTNSQTQFCKRSQHLLMNGTQDDLEKLLLSLDMNQKLLDQKVEKIVQQEKKKKELIAFQQNKVDKAISFDKYLKSIYKEKCKILTLSSKLQEQCHKLKEGKGLNEQMASHLVRIIDQETEKHKNKNQLFLVNYEKLCSVKNINSDLSIKTLCNRDRPMPNRILSLEVTESKINEYLLKISSLGSKSKETNKILNSWNETYCLPNLKNDSPGGKLQIACEQIQKAILDDLIDLKLFIVNEKQLMKLHDEIFLQRQKVGQQLLTKLKQVCNSRLADERSKIKACTNEIYQDSSMVQDYFKRIDIKKMTTIFENLIQEEKVLQKKDEALSLQLTNFRENICKNDEVFKVLPNLKNICISTFTSNYFNRLSLSKKEDLVLKIESFKSEFVQKLKIYKLKLSDVNTLQKFICFKQKRSCDADLKMIAGLTLPSLINREILLKNLIKSYKK